MQNKLDKGVGYVLVRRVGERWRADVYVRPSGGGRPRLVAEITGSLPCVQRVAREAPSMMGRPGGDELLLDFLRANRLRILAPARAGNVPLTGNDPADRDLKLPPESTRKPNELDGRGFL